MVSTKSTQGAGKRLRIEGESESQQAFRHDAPWYGVDEMWHTWQSLEISRESKQLLSFSAQRAGLTEIIGMVCERRIGPSDGPQQARLCIA